MTSPKITHASEYVTYSELLALQDAAERAEMYVNLGGRWEANYYAALERVTAARTTFERQRAEEEKRRAEQEERERRRREYERYVRTLDRTRGAA
ncbi:hypothetical protein [Nocardia farcinica]|uniref:hypothetical protein n=1 Tax=Nocardia farcinica TaxID=37329 RepID=UPI0024569402|nr:hypothetical protein [Nocardia farcinica]